MTTINQNYNTQSGTSQEISATVGSAHFSEGQGYCIIIGFFIVLIVIVQIIGKIIQTAILKINVLNKKQIDYIIESIKDDLENNN